MVEQMVFDEFLSRLSKFLTFHACYSIWCLMNFLLVITRFSHSLHFVFMIEYMMPDGIPSREKTFLAYTTLHVHGRSHDAWWNNFSSLHDFHIFHKKKKMNQETPTIVLDTLVWILAVSQQQREVWRHTYSLYMIVFSISLSLLW